MGNHHHLLLSAERQCRVFQSDLNLVDWLRQYSKDKDETYVRGFLGRMLFTGEETQKKCNVLSGGEKVRCMVSRMMLTNAQLPRTRQAHQPPGPGIDHRLQQRAQDWKHIALFTSHDHTFVQTVANRIIEITPNGCIDKEMSYDEYLASENVKEQRAKAYGEVLA